MVDQGQEDNFLPRIISEAAKMLTDEGIVLWLNSPVPKFNGYTPMDYMQAGKYHEVLELVQSYGDFSFG
jgi:hypothetical protein